MLTLEMLKILKPDIIFATGVLSDSPEGINMTRSGKLLRWVAVTGYVADWTIYCHWEYQDEFWIKRYGDKVINRENIEKCVPCNDEAFKRYRI